MFGLKTFCRPLVFHACRRLVV